MRLPAIPARSASADPPVPLDLPRQVMRRSSLVGVVVLLLAVVLGLVRMGADIEDEVDAAITLAGVMARLGQMSQTDDRSALEGLRAMQAEHHLRHLALHVHAQDGQLLLGPPPEAASSAPLAWLLAMHSHWLSPPDARRVVWTVPRAGGTFWTVSLAASHESERREAMGSFVDMLALLLVCVAGLLLVMHWNLRLAFAPLGRLLEAIAGIEQHDAQAVRSLPTMPIRELESVAVALRHLGAALDAAEAHRRLLSQQVLTLQEDERARLARDLHDEFGQRLTALRVDAAWLARQVHDQPALKDVVDGMAAQCALVQADIRSLLTRLQPFGPPTAAAQDAESLARGLALLQALVNSWHGGERPGGMTCRLELQWQDADGLVQPFPEGTEAEGMGWPRPLWLTIYRISQEALTNSARHAQAGELALSLHCRGGRLPGQALRIDWQARDDGIGLPTTRSAALPRGNGLAGLQERVWAQGGELQLAPWRPGHARPGLVLGAGFDTCLQALPDGQNRFVAVLGEPR